MGTYVPHNSVSGSNYEFGHDEELLHIQIMRSKGYNIIPAKKLEDAFKKVDYWLIHNEKKYGVDVKTAQPRSGDFCISCSKSHIIEGLVIYFAFRIKGFIYFVKASD
ncbi:MAG: hypothetical protein II453_12210, partial [Alphaproteobacteria bacterium]|nr:hypothetical protein [Alphaproteobacteria bacterium]